ncbi:N-acetyltransferase [Leucobacter rhizosphaerae]|uniref:N-acetyltransferase n=1 Tax=Leucobacter rhizosphaerae TaxID=2932245 RepID=A0ABY4FWC4_9MICO|nr:GNAT family N-acetyltransferase [Leucobacter rhizosphaerae]UOQ60611.1 N-acetyltransferase [Leucobacter rhizosphaerae]
MATYSDETQAAAAGFRIEHQPEAQRYAVLQAGDTGDRLVGEAHYTLIGGATINFDHTVVLPEFRGSGLSGLLAHHALTGEAVGDRRIIASCSYIAGYLERHPELQRS